MLILLKISGCFLLIGMFGLAVNVIWAAPDKFKYHIYSTMPATLGLAGVIAFFIYYIINL